MSGSPTEAEIQAQWRAAVDILETTRVHIDETIADGGGKFDTLIQALEGEYTPAGMAAAVRNYRARLSSLVSGPATLEYLSPVLFEYGGILAADATLGFGSVYSNLAELWPAIYEWFIDNSLTVESRNITFDITPTLGGSNVGNGALSRLFTDHNALDLEFCAVEKKTLRCRRDQNTGVRKDAEEFEIIGEQASQDAVLRSSFGSGARKFIRSHHAGTGDGGSLLQNSSFSTFDSTASPKFAGWDEAAGGANIAQDTTNFFRTHPGATTDASLKITGGSGIVTLKQTLANMNTQRIEVDRPYFLRVMLNKTVGTASGGAVIIRMGSQSVSVTIAAMAANWTELLIVVDESCWPRVFNEDPFDIEIEWGAASASGFLLVDDVLFAPFDAFDGTFWFLRGNAAGVQGTHVPWLVDDTLLVTDTGGLPATAKIQYWNYIAGVGYLPHTTGTPTFTEP